MLNVWLETKAWNPDCINLRDQSLLSARAPPGSVQPGINSCVPEVSYGYRIQRWSCDMALTALCCCCAVFAPSFSFSLALNRSPTGPQRSGLGQAPAPLVPSLPSYSKVGSLAYRASETPGGYWQRTKVKDIPLPHRHLCSMCLFVNYISNGGHNKT